MTEGFGHRRFLAPRHDASHAIRVPRVRILPSASFRSHLTMGTLAVRLGVPVIKASKGLAPSSHFPVGFRLPVDSARQGAARHAWRTSSSPGGSLPRGPHQIRTWRFPPSGSSADVARGSRATTVRSCGDMIRRRRSAGHGSLRTITPTRAAFARPGPGGYPFPGVIARMQPSVEMARRKGTLWQREKGPLCRVPINAFSSVERGPSGSVGRP